MFEKIETLLIAPKIVFLSTFKILLLSVGETHMTATINQDTIISRTINEVFPDYESVIPTDNKKTLKVEKNTVLGAIRRVSIFSNKSTHQVAFNISKDKILIHTEDPELSSRAKEEIIGSYEGDALTIGYNGEYLKDIINHISGDEVVIKLNTPPDIIIFLVSSTLGMAGNSSFCFPIKS